MFTIYYAKASTNRTGSDRVRNYKEMVQNIQVYLMQDYTHIDVYDDKTGENVFNYSKKEVDK